MLSIFKAFPYPFSSEQQPFLSPESEADDADTYCLYRMKDGTTEQHWAMALADYFYISGCTRIFCAIRSDTDDDDDDDDDDIEHTGPASHARESLPSIHSVMEVLYPPSHLATPTPILDPPSYSRNDSLAPISRGNYPEMSSLSLSLSRSRPLNPSLTGVPAPNTFPFGISPLEPGPPAISSDRAVQEEPLPAYSRFDQHQPRFPVASSVLGPYPPPSVIRQSAR